MEHILFQEAVIMAQLKGSICVHYASVELAENALNRARKMFLSTTPASFDRSRRDTNIVYFPRGVAANIKGHHVSDTEIGRASCRERV